MKTLILLFSLLLAASTVSFAQQEMPKFDAAKLPMDAANPEAFVIDGWKVEEVVKGDLNGDGTPDAAIKLTNGMKNKDDVSGDRALVIALNVGGKWRRTATSKGILQCVECGGAFYGVMPAPAGVTIEKGILVVENEHGSRNVDTATFRFRLDQATGRFVLIGFDFVDVDRAVAGVTTESTNYSTNLRITDPAKGRKKRVSIKPTKIFLEDADYEKLEGEALHRNGLD